ncbi:MAG: TlpA family protein disulfide reductase, partial [Chitinophagaceae bacterium]
APCIASFPTMNKIIQHYNNRNDVEFLFINSMENDEETRLEKIKSVLKKHQLDFNVLIDQKNNQGFEVASKFKISGLPSQFIIDKNGIVRFSLKGFDGNVDSMIEEVKLMIEKTLTY